MFTSRSTDRLLGEMPAIVSSVFETMLNLEISPVDCAWRPAPDHVIARVQLSGEWRGAIELECDGHQARHFASRFVGSDRLEDPRTLARDVLGELVNMIGGNLKCVLDRGIVLSTPSVAEGSDTPAALPKLREHRAVTAFTCGEGTFWIRLLELSAGAAAN